MLASSAIVGLNHLLRDTPWARERLSPFAGRSARILLHPLEIGLGIDGEGYFCESAALEPDVTLELPLGSLPKLVGGADALMSDIRISGNADLADALGFVLRKLRWDGEEALSQLTGDIVAHRAVSSLKQFAGWQAQAARNVVENLAEYLSEEQPVLVRRALMDDLGSAGAALRDDLARLEKRLQKLESRRR